MKSKNFKILKLALFPLLFIGIIACKSDRDEDIGREEVLKKSYTTERFKVLNIVPNLPGNAKLTWIIKDFATSESNTLEFISPYAKTYPLTLRVEVNGATTTYNSEIIVNTETKPYSKFISNVFDFRPAVGQFTNEIPEYIAGNTSEQMIQKAKQSLVGSNSSIISLGGFGGYVIFGFDHTIPNMNGRDFKILGNTFWAAGANQERTGSCEPGIIMVAYDKNKNGKPDEDEWYEIAGSEYFNNTTVKNYEITYYKPNNNKPSVLGNKYWETDIEYIKWEDNQGNYGYKTKNTFHDHNYYPLWISDAYYSFTGTKLANNYRNQKNGTEDYWVGKSYDFGYADNAPNNDEASNIDISWAVDKNGNYIKLPGIDFVKIYTGINQEAGWLGEVSTEVGGAYDLYLN